MRERRWYWDMWETYVISDWGVESEVRWYWSQWYPLEPHHCTSYSSTYLLSWFHPKRMMAGQLGHTWKPARSTSVHGWCVHVRKHHVHTPFAYRYTVYLTTGRGDGRYRHATADSLLLLTFSLAYAILFSAFAFIRRENEMRWLAAAQTAQWADLAQCSTLELDSSPAPSHGKNS